MEQLQRCSSMISAFCKQLREFCSNLDTSCTDLRTRVVQVPAPLYCDATSLLDGLNDRISQTTAEVEVLKGLTLGTICFQELLGHCMELYKENEVVVSELENNLISYGYVSGTITNEAHSIQDASVCTSVDASVCTSVDENSHFHSDELVRPQILSRVDGLKLKIIGTETQGILPAATFVPTTYTPLHSCLRQTNEPAIYPSVSSCLSITDFGLSAAGLAALSREEDSPNETYLKDNAYHREEAQIAIDRETLKREVSPKKIQATVLCTKKNSEDLLVAVPAGHVEQITHFSPTKEYSEEKFDHALISNVSLEDFNKCPTWLKWQVSLQEVNDFVNKLNSLVVTKDRVADPIITQDDVTSLGVGDKTQKACLLLLLRLERLAAMHNIGSTTYHIKN